MAVDFTKAPDVTGSVAQGQRLTEAWAQIAVLTDTVNKLRALVPDLAAAPADANKVLKVNGGGTATAWSADAT